ncbi:hypothetical protein G8J22_01662 [Lentilactobacillus hilgardii]|uniref:CPBP family intramembrane glutamic endopeptidase n=1 Tax=Lentilactobacillus hilgardii TaxID=1588 RepID=UPI00019C6574|nr:type II CAAX endopeptidase family protein [Lentilactobacillus hilgardii]EEI18414.1 CAAX amino terminal protease family protein [Lentilactobacillus buchneri ATCC 11577]MCT3396611.1 CPBP family intramembrane metalloprotease [Lentilactobacillus hilgardii]QIR09680.1 hypothetical protein G8J22_01662 [Lentilactobacillus hilgardii]
MDENKRLKAGDYFERIGIFVGLVIIVIFVQFPLSFIMMGDFSHLVNNIIAVVYILGFVLAIAVAGYFYRKYAHPQKMSITSRDISMIFIAYVSFFVVQIGLGLLNQAIYHQSSTANNKIIYQYMNTNHLTLILMGFTAVFCSPILEELVFRGFLIGSMFTTNTRVAAVIVSGVLFAFPHMEDFNVISFLTYAILGGTLAYLYVRTKNIKVPIGLHFLNNLIAMGMMLVQIVLNSR